MSIERANFNVPARVSDQGLPERYQQPSAMTKAGQVDRRHEAQHVVRMRDMQREAIEQATEQAQALPIPEESSQLPMFRAR